MLQLKLYTITFFFLLSTVFACATPPRCKNRSTGNRTIPALPKAAGAASSSTFKNMPTIAQAPTQVIATQAITTPTTSNPAAQVTPSSVNSSGSTSAADIQAYLTAHNSIRAQHDAVPLTWNNTLAGKAQQWANHCLFQHSGGTLGPFGENLAAGTGAYPISEAVKSWTDEVSEYNANDPVPSHFTQVVWKATTQVGCAVQSCKGIFSGIFSGDLAQYYVCEYFEEGNVLGLFSQNVQV